VVLKDDNRLKAPGLHLIAQGIEIEGSFTHRLVQILMAVVVVKVQFEKPIRESIQPFLESYPGKDQKMADIKAKSQFLTEFFPQLGEVIGPCVENIFEADPGVDSACRFEEFTPHAQAVLYPQLLAKSEPEFVETGVKHDLPRPHFVGQFHDLGKAEPCDLQDPRVETAGGEIDKGSVKCEFLTVFPPFDHCGKVVFSDGIKKFPRQVDLREKAATIQEFEILVKVLQTGPTI